jgi:hypothetical protein
MLLKTAAEVGHLFVSQSVRRLLDAEPGLKEKVRLLKSDACDEFTQGLPVAAVNKALQMAERKSAVMSQVPCRVSRLDHERLPIADLLEMNPQSFRCVSYLRANDRSDNCHGAMLDNDQLLVPVSRTIHRESPK